MNADKRDQQAIYLKRTPSLVSERHLSMNPNNRIRTRILVLLATLMLLTAVSANAQTTQFTYQGKLSDGGSPANGSYDFQFKLFDTLVVNTGTQQGSTLTLSNISVASGSFSVQLDFGSCGSCFNGANRFLEISVKRTSAPTFLVLDPRQQITSTPYSLKSILADGLSTSCMNCVTSTQIQS